MEKSEETLRKLEEQQASIKNKIKKIKLELRSETRKNNVRRKVLIGEFILSEIENGNYSKEKLFAGLDKFINKNNDRALFNLSPRENNEF